MKSSFLPRFNDVQLPTDEREATGGPQWVQILKNSSKGKNIIEFGRHCGRYMAQNVKLAFSRKFFYAHSIVGDLPKYI